MQTTPSYHQSSPGKSYSVFLASTGCNELDATNKKSKIPASTECNEFDEAIEKHELWNHFGTFHQSYSTKILFHFLATLWQHSYQSILYQSFTKQPTMKTTTFFAHLAANFVPTAQNWTRKEQNNGKPSRPQCRAAQ